MREVTERGIVDPSGSKFQKDIDYVESRGVKKEHTEGETEIESIYTDVHNETMNEWNSPVIRETKRSDLPRKLRKNGSEEEINEWYKEHPFKFENKQKLKDYSYEGIFLEATTEHRKKILQDSGITPEELWKAINDPKNKNKIEESAKNAISSNSEQGFDISGKELDKMNTLLSSILRELQAGVTVTTNQ